MNVIYMPSMYAVETPLPFLILSFHVCHRSSCSKTGSFWLRNMTIQLSNELNPIFPFPTTLLGTLLARFFEKKRAPGPPGHPNGHRRHLSWGTSPTFALMLCYVQNDVKHRFYGRVSPLGWWFPILQSFKLITSAKMDLPAIQWTLDQVLDLV